jgi:hypothetical protein
LERLHERQRKFGLGATKQEENVVKLRLLKLETVRAVVAVWCSLNVSGSLNASWALNLGVAFAVQAWGGPSAIGTAAAQGSFRVDDATVAGNATLFEGTTVETHQSASRLDMTSGARLSLAAESKARIFSDRLILERGSGRMERAAGIYLEAHGLTVRMENGAGSAQVALAGSGRIQVAALIGSLRVLNPQGLLVAAIHSGSALEFAFQASGTPSKLSGCLVAVAGHYLVTDETTNVAVEVGGSGAGSGLAKESGNRVQITGVMDPSASPVSGATEYIRVSGVKRLSRGCAATDKAAAAGAGGGAGGNAGSPAGGAGKTGGGIGAISVATIAVIGGVAAAALVGGLAASGTLSGASAAAVSR